MHWCMEANHTLRNAFSSDLDLLKQKIFTLAPTMVGPLVPTKPWNFFFSRTVILIAIAFRKFGRHVGLHVFILIYPTKGVKRINFYYSTSKRWVKSLMIEKKNIFLKQWRCLNFLSLFCEIEIYVCFIKINVFQIL